MGIMDLEVQRERRVQMLRAAESKRGVRRGRSGIKARAISMLASMLASIR